MKRITLAMLLVAAATTAVAQDPTPPARPARPAQPPSAPQPVAPRPAAAPVPMRLWDPMDRLDQEAIRDMARDAQREAMAAQRDAQRDVNEAMREAQREANDAAREAQRGMMDAQREASRLAMDFDRGIGGGVGRGIGFGVERGIAPMALAPMAPMAPMLAMPAMAPFDAPMARAMTLLDSRADAFREHAPPPAWAQGDPADSLYRIARDAFSSGDYGRSARLFAEISQKYPTSNYKNDAPYYEALSRYKIGTTEELRLAAKVIEPLASKVTNTTTTTSTNISVSRPGAAGFSYANVRRNATDSEVATLYNRINGALAQRGDREAADKIAKAASQAGSAACDQEDVAVKTEALNALSQMDPATALPILRRVLDRKDECSVPLRNNAVFMLGRRNDPESAALLLSVAKGDSSVTVRRSAISYLTRLPGDAGLNALEELLRTEKDERIQQSVVHSLMQSDNPKARASMRALIDRKDAPVTLRIEAINSYNSDHVTAEDAAYLRNLYGKAESDQMKRAIIDAVSRIGGAENDAWVLNVAKNTNETSSLRAAALGRLARSNSSTSIADIGKLYDAADSRNIRQQIINILASRKEPEATDKLIDITKTSTDYDMRRQALSALMRKNDPRTEKILTDILAGEKKP